MPKISNEKLQMYFTSGGVYYPLFVESVKLYNDLKVHADGVFPSSLIEKQRPNESEEILKYRKDIYEPITKLPLSKVINCYSKIRRSPDWMINFPAEKVSSKIVDEETLEDYCNEKLPGFGSITNWAFDILLPQNLIDANAVIAVIPVKNIVSDSFAEPAPILFNSDLVMILNEQEKYCILKSRIKVNYLDKNNVFQAGERFYYIDENEIAIYEQTENGYAQVFYQVNTIAQFPVFKVKSESFMQFENMTLHRSRLHAMVPFLNKAASGDSDLDGSKIQHLNPLFWYFQNKSCNSCEGTGKTATENGAVECKTCSGTGKVKFSPFAHIQVDPAGLGNQANPIPPAGYVVRDTAILELQEKTVEKNNYKALAAMNMQFLDQTPLAISGTAKQVDREELNNTVFNTAEDLVYAIDKVIFFINEWRYIYVVPDKNTRREMLPNIPVPQNYDLLPEDYLMKEVTDARTAKVNPLLIATLEQQLAAKKFYNQPELACNIKLYFDLDPLPGLSVDEKMSLISNQAITKEDFVISSYMASFIKRALREDSEFDKKDYSQQISVLSKYAAEKMKANDTAAQMIDAQKQAVLLEIQANGGQQPAGQSAAKQVGQPAGQ
jgi:hypothetical protein